MGKKIFNIQFYKDPSGIPPKYMLSWTHLERYLETIMIGSFANK